MRKEASVEANGHQRRFLVSGKLRADMTKKLVKSIRGYSSYRLFS